MESLCSNFHLSLVEAEESAWGLTLVYQNSTTGLRLEYCPGEQDGWRAVIARLDAGAFPKHPIYINDDTELHRFDLRDLATERINDLADFSEKISSLAPLTIFEIAEIVTRIAPDLMAGNFSVFSALRSRVLARVQAIRAAS